MISTFTMERFAAWFAPLTRAVSRIAGRWSEWRERRRQRREEKAAARREKRGEKPQPKPRPLPPETAPEPETEPAEQEIPICTLEDTPPWEPPTPAPTSSLEPKPPVQLPTTNNQQPVFFHLPATDLLNEPPVRSEFDELELKNIAVRVKSKFEE